MFYSIYQFCEYAIYRMALDIKFVFFSNELFFGIFETLLNLLFFPVFYFTIQFTPESCFILKCRFSFFYPFESPLVYSKFTLIALLPVAELVDADCWSSAERRGFESLSTKFILFYQNFMFDSLPWESSLKFCFQTRQTSNNPCFWLSSECSSNLLGTTHLQFVIWTTHLFDLLVLSLQTFLACCHNWSQSVGSDFRFHNGTKFSDLLFWVQKIWSPFYLCTPKRSIPIHCID